MSSFNLVDHAKAAARDAVNSLDKPDDDILPVVLAYGPRGLAIIGAPMAGDEEGKDRLADAMTARIAVHQATEAVMVCVAYVTLIKPAEAEVGARQENVVLFYDGPSGPEAWAAKLTRHEDRPPDMSLWQSLGDGSEVAGRFADAIHNGLAFARSSHKDPEMVQILEQGHQEGRVDELVAMFLAAKEALEGQNVNNGKA